MSNEKLKYKLGNSEIVIILLFSLIKLFIHLYTNTFASHGMFRDELYYLSCASRPDIGYVDQPPLSIFILGISRLFLGDSLFAIRLLPAIAGALTVFITGMMVKKMDGRTFAITIASLAVIFAPIYFGMNTFFSMNAFDILLWAVAFYLITLIVKEDNPKLWIWLGIVLGLGLMNKIGFLWLGFGLFIGLLFMDRNKLRTKNPWITAGIAFIIFLPFIIWNATYDWAHIEFIRNAQMYKYSEITRGDFVMWIFILMNPASAVIWILGLYYLFFNKGGKQFKILGIIFIVTFLILFISGKSKSEYLSPAFTPLFAAGGIILEQISSRKFWKWLKYVVIIPLVVSGIITAPLALPILPVETYINYAASIGFGPSTSENKELAELPQFYADMFGWEELAKNVSAVYQTIPEEEKDRTLIYTNNYGEAGAVEYYSEKYPLPPVISAHNNFWIWGWDYLNEEIKNVIIIGGNIEDHLESCEEAEMVLVHKVEYVMPYENNLPIFLCRNLIRDFQQIWENTKHFE
ncbi:MAG: glycosyltransferase family 39 protein [Ignavibacterium sp.]|nr:MAG: glycosyltransferase family 39 protein [Ignavibacterium sp.]